MIKRFSAALAVFLMGGAVAALAATKEYRITVPVEVRPPNPGFHNSVPANWGITVHCAVGYANIAYSSGSGAATNALGDGSVHATLKMSYGPFYEVPSGAVVVVTAPIPETQTGQQTGKGATNYVCWGVLDQAPGVTSTPVNFIQGAIPVPVRPGISI